MKAITQPSMIKYPTLWSSVVKKGDILVNRQGYAVPIGETEWATLSNPATFIIGVLLNAPPWEYRQFQLADNWTVRKFVAEYLGMATTNAKHGQDVFVEG